MSEFITTPRMTSAGFATMDLPFAADWHVIHDTSCNALLIGPPLTVNAAVAWLLPRVRTPIFTWNPEVLREPSIPSTGTLVIQNVDALDCLQQQHLLEQLSDRTQPIRVISLASSPIYPVVQRCDFLEDLYYRLNVLCLNVD